jgi:hypothetical protein
VIPNLIIQLQPAAIVQIQLLISVLGIFGAGLASYVGVKVAIAEMRRDLKNHQERLDYQDRRLERLESPFFQKS